ncbi:hypothetical protein NIF40_05590 [[Clostridium] leptum]|nr:hypothetical protein [[Clostridium] leptum]
MTEKELRKEYNRVWKELRPRQHLAWLICYVEAWVPVFVVLIQLIGGINDEKMTIIIICIVIFVILELISTVIMVAHMREWPKYLEANKERLQSSEESKKV